MNKKIKRIAVIGPESSGKSTLCKQLSEYYNEPWVKEFSRQYLPSLKRKYQLNDILSIYREQLKIETGLISSAHKYIFTDTEYIIAKIWCRYIFHEVPDIIEELITKHSYDYYILTSPDLPWEADPLREHPGKGSYFYNIYKQELEMYQFKYGIVSGSGKERLNLAIKLIDEL